MDRRLTPANGRVADAGLRGKVEAERFTEGEARRVRRSVVDLLRAPGGPRDRQLLMGDAVQVYERRDGFAFVQAAKDGYVGYLDETALGDDAAPTHWVAVPASHAYEAPDMKSPERLALVFGNGVKVTGTRGAFFETADGLFVPRPHLWPVAQRFDDPVTAAQLHLGVPYLWGGNSIRGIDCSGLIQAALLAAGRTCPGDSDLQQAALGQEIAPDVPLRRGDLLFWGGHVGIMADAETLLHANAHDMAVALEPVEAAIARIAAQGDGEVTARRRL